MYDIITRAPTIVWSPGRFQAGVTIDDLCQQMDLGPAILELAGAEVPETMEAKSILPLLRGEGWGSRDYVFAEHSRDGILQGTEFMSMVRSLDWKLVHFLDQPDGQLFDLTDDPDEINNLWHQAEFADKKQELMAVLREWHIRSQYQTAGWAAEWR